MSSREQVMNEIARIAEQKSMMALGDGVRAISGVTKADFSFEPHPHYRVKVKGGDDIVVINAQYAEADDGDITAGGLVIGSG